MAKYRHSIENTLEVPKNGWATLCGRRIKHYDPFSRKPRCPVCKTKYQVIWDKLWKDCFGRQKGEWDMEHMHNFKQHPTWTTHVVCTVCGFAIPNGPPLSCALGGGATMDKKQSDSLLNSLEADLTFALANFQLLDTNDIRWMLLKVKDARRALEERN